MSECTECNAGNPVIAFFSVLYNPDANALVNIKNSIRHGFASYVYVNKVGDNILRELESMAVTVLGNNKNVGLGPAFYEFESVALRKGIASFVYFDQDTIVNDVAWERIKKSSLQILENSGAGLLYYTSRELPYCPKVAISSGCFFSLEVIAKVGKHNPAYFVEGVDYEFCLRLRERGYRIMNIPIEGIDHYSLQDGENRKIAGLNLKIRYYGMRRLLDFNRSHGKLIWQSLQMRDCYMAIFFAKSAIKFNLKNALSKIVSLGS